MIYLPFETRNQGLRGVLTARGNLTMNIWVDLVRAPQGLLDDNSPMAGVVKIRILVRATFVGALRRYCTCGIS